MCVHVCVSVCECVSVWWGAMLATVKRLEGSPSGKVWEPEISSGKKIPPPSAISNLLH